MKIAGIYMIKNKTNNKVYIGSSKDVRKRWSSHKSDLKYNIHHSRHLQRSWDKYGENSFSFIFLECLLDNSIIYEREQFWMDYFQSYNIKLGYNINPKARTNKGLHLSEEQRKKISETKKRAKLKHDEIAIKKIREASTGSSNGNSKLNEETVKISWWLYNKTALTAKEISRYFNVNYSAISKIGVISWKHLNFKEFKMSKIQEYFWVNEILNNENKITLREIKEIKLILKFSNLRDSDLSRIYKIGIGIVRSIRLETYRFNIDVTDYNYLPRYLKELMKCHQ